WVAARDGEQSPARSDPTEGRIQSLAMGGPLEWEKILFFGPLPAHTFAASLARVSNGRRILSAGDRFSLAQGRAGEQLHVRSSLRERTVRAIEPRRAQFPLRAGVGRLPALNPSTALRREKPLLLERRHAEAPAQALWRRRWDREAEAVLEHGAGLELQRQWR